MIFDDGDGQRAEAHIVHATTRKKCNSHSNFIVAHMSEPRRHRNRRVLFYVYGIKL